MLGAVHLAPCGEGRQVGQMLGQAGMKQDQNGGFTQTLHGMQEGAVSRLPASMTWAFGVSAGFAGQAAPFFQVVVIDGGEQPRDRRLPRFEPVIAKLFQLVPLGGLFHHNDDSTQPLGDRIRHAAEHLCEHCQQSTQQRRFAAARNEGDGKYTLTAIVQHLFYDVRQSVSLTI